jgi:hypothetical protein
MLDRLLAILLRLVLTTLIAASGAVAVMSAYDGFTQLVRAHFNRGGSMLGIAAVAGFVAYVLGTRRGDLADC